MYQTVFLDAASMGDADLSPLQADNIALTCFNATTPAQVLNRLQQADIAIVNKVVLDATTLAALPRLKLICLAATGANNIDLAGAQQHGIAVCNVRGYADTAVPQQVFALLLQLTNKVQQYQNAVRAGRWSQSPHFCLLDYPVTELAGKTMLIVGYGALGQATAKLAQAFGMQVLLSEQPDASICRAGRLPFFTALAQADVVSLHCPLTAGTERLFNARAFAAMKPGALLINTARGGLIDETALLQALQQGTLAGAALDVLTEEPPPPAHPLVLADLPQLIITPHMAWASAEARQRMVQQLAANVQAFAGGQLRNALWPQH
ncbi:D-2-hydroxyacid dehydrogenase [Rheinheimera nanhaiensis]|uniref:Glycerate dehydrogenase n=1 Tax=Rheinheimera nanhaiensis E407-8 TaxID=562729 RepID=I1DXW4_9GAMM|nr:D-2-hydroxyacid dehydrogenase [Rheinheimera nanhaiensis]GAB58892.1 glycerate dehydrogenase [Rheinheimera nanhaiensis E407-8]